MRRIPAWLLAVVDQAMIAVANLSLSILFAREADLFGLGIYALIGATTVVLVGIFRTLVGDPWLASSRRAGRSPTGYLRFWIGVGCVASIIPICVVVLVLTHGLSTGWLISILVAPVMIAQDAGRYLSYKIGEPHLAAASDAIALVVIVAVGSLGVLTSLGGIAWLCATWVAAYMAALLPTLRLLVGPVTFRWAGRWWQTVCRDLGMPLLLDQLAFYLSVIGLLYILAAVGSPSEVGVVRVVNSLFSPVALVFTGCQLWLIPWLTRRSRADTGRVVALTTAILAGLALAMSAIVVGIGPWVSKWLFGAGAVPTRLALLLGGAATCCNAVSTIWLSVVKVYGRYRAVSVVRTFSAVLMVGSILGCAVLQTASGYLALVAAQSAIIAIVAFCAHLWIKHEQADVTLRSGSAR